MRVLVLVLMLLVTLPTISAVDFTCGDNICQMNENFRSCPDDCHASVQDNYCNPDIDEICDPDCYRTDPDCRNFEESFVVSKSPSYFWLKILFIMVFMAGVGFGAFILYKKSLKGQNIYSEKQIDTFSNIKKTNEKTWSNQTETEIVQDIKNSEDFRRYAGGNQ